MWRIAGALHRAEIMIVGIGVDAVDVERFARVLERTPGTRDRLFTPDELAYADSLSDPTASLAARFAVREAAMKALGVGLGAFDFHDIAVRRHESGRPILLAGGRAARLAADLGVDRWWVSMSHTDDLAVAYVIAEGTPPASGVAPGEWSGSDLR